MTRPGLRPMQHRQFYPGDCGRQVREFLVAASPPPPDCPPALVAAVLPHAGWRYSGAVAARALRTLAERCRAQALVIFGAVHREWLEKAAVYPSGAWETPFGPVEVEETLAREVLLEIRDLLEANPGAHDSEHSIEVEMPLVHELLPGVPVIPIMVPPGASPAEVGRRTARLVAGRGVVAAASTDLTHYGPGYGFLPAGSGETAHDWMRGNDRRILDLAVRLQAERIPLEAQAHRNACGPGALAATVAFARELGAREGVLLEHTDSHQVQGAGEPFEMGVGYAGMVF